MISIREAASDDLADIQAIYSSAFDDDEKNQVARLAANLLNEEIHPETFALVAEQADQLVGHVGLSPVMFDSINSLSGYILAPLAVRADVQKQGIGSMLVKGAMAKLSQQSVNILFVYGDPRYYGRFGFGTDIAQSFVPPYELEFPFGWMAVVLNATNGLGEQKHKLGCVESLNDPALW